MAKFIKITVKSEALAKALGVTAGEDVKVETRQGVPVSREWRNRLRDMKIDKCISLADKPKSAPKKSNKEAN